MFSSEQKPARRDGYEQVGELIPIGESNITANDALMVRDFLAYDFFDRVRCRTPQFSETKDRTQFGKGFNAHGGAEFDKNFFAGAVLRHLDPESWFAIVMIAKHSRSTTNNTPLRTESRYRIGMAGLSILQATKEVRVLRSVGELTADDIVNGVEIPTQRKAFEKALTTDDCGQMLGQLERVARRASI